ncbi:MAG TPA: thioredoxin family protein [Chthoniobacter sp.]
MSPFSALSRTARLLIAVVCGLLLLASASAQENTATVRAVTATLLADTTAIEPGKPFTVGVRFDIDPGWDIYWQFAGDIAMPTKLQWDLPPGFTAGPLQWPLPDAHMADGDILGYVYTGQTMLFAQITPPAQLPSGPVPIKAKASWQMCDAQRCEQGDAKLALNLPPGPAQPANADVFNKWRAQAPTATFAPPFAVKWDRSKDKEFSLQIKGVAKDTPVEFFPFPMPGLKPGHPNINAIADDGARTITFPLEDGKPNLPWRGVVVTGKEGGQREGWIVSADAGAAATPAPSIASTSTAASQTLSGPPAASKGSLLWTLFIAFVGGLIMNIMPCVLPVITLKIYGFVNQAGEAPGRVFRLGLAFSGGVFAFFLTLAVFMANLRGAFNWGYQLQNPYLLATVISLVFLFGLSLLGVFEVALTGGATSTLGELSSKEGYGGAFLHGLFTTLLGTSCTAPFLGASLSYAVTQSVPIIFLIFIAIATGMCLPYFLLSAHPAWMRFLPKPGMWMERAKQVMGFIMLAIAAWLFGVFAGRGPDAVAGMSWFLVILGFAAWLFGLHGHWITRVAALALPIAGYWFFLDGNINAAKPAEASNAGIEQRINAARAAGVPVFIDFTADWCPNCKFYEKTVLRSDAIQTKFREKEVVFIKADWTNTDDPEVTRLLKSYGAVGIPLYVFYRPGESQPLVKESLTKSGLLEELDKVKSPPAKSLSSNEKAAKTAEN